jgi:hypothetical protein
MKFSAAILNQAGLAGNGKLLLPGGMNRCDLLEGKCTH